MNLTHWVRKEDSGLFRSAIEFVNCEEQLGHGVAIRSPSDNVLIYGNDHKPDAHVVHSQLNPGMYHDGVPKFMMMHGEPLSSVGNGISMKSIIELAPLCTAFLCMRREEQPIWNSIKRTHLIRKGVDLDRYRPLPGGSFEKLSGSPAVLYCENWRRERNPLYLCVAMQEVHRKYPDARLHLYNCTDPKMHATFKSLWQHNSWWPFMRSLNGPVEDINLLYNQADIVVSCLFPLFARGIEALAAGTSFICPGYREPGYPWKCELDPGSIAAAIIECWENRMMINARHWAEDRHSAMDSTKEAIAVYEKYL